MAPEQNRNNVVDANDDRKHSGTPQHRSAVTTDDDSHHATASATAATATELDERESTNDDAALPPPPSSSSSSSSSSPDRRQHPGLRSSGTAAAAKARRSDDEHEEADEDGTGAGGHGRSATQIADGGAAGTPKSSSLATAESASAVAARSSGREDSSDTMAAAAASIAPKETSKNLRQGPDEDRRVDTTRSIDGVSMCRGGRGRPKTTGEEEEKEEEDGGVAIDGRPGDGTSAADAKPSSNVKPRPSESRDCDGMVKEKEAQKTAPVFTRCERRDCDRKEKEEAESTAPVAAAFAEAVATAKSQSIPPPPAAGVNHTYATGVGGGTRAETTTTVEETTQTTHDGQQQQEEEDQLGDASVDPSSGSSVASGFNSLPSRASPPHRPSSQPGAFAMPGPGLLNPAVSEAASGGTSGLLLMPQLRRSEAVTGVQQADSTPVDTPVVLSAFVPGEEPEESRRLRRSASRATSVGTRMTSGTTRQLSIATDGTGGEGDETDVLHAEVMSVSVHSRAAHAHAETPTLEGVVVHDGLSVTRGARVGAAGRSMGSGTSLGSSSGGTPRTGGGGGRKFFERRNGPKFVAIVAVTILAAVIVVVSVVLVGRRDDGGSGAPDVPNDAALDDVSPDQNANYDTDDPTFVATRDFLVRAGADASALRDETSPQHRALRWLVFEDDWEQTMADGTMINPSEEEETTSATTNDNFYGQGEIIGTFPLPDDTGRRKAVVQRFVAATLLFSSSMTENRNDTDRRDFMRGDECGWNEVPTDFSYGLLGGFECTDSASGDGGEVTSIYFGQGFETLVGTLPEDIGLLPQLRHLFLIDDVKLVGPIPRSLSKLTMLERLALTRTGLNGTIPDLTSTGSTLRQLVLSSNSLVGTVPGNIGELSELVFLSLDDNALTGPIPDSVALLSQLTILGMSRNELSGTIPPMDAARSLMSFGLGMNRLTGTVPGGWSDTLRYLFLEKNELSGSLPTGLGSLGGLRALFLHSNFISGTIPAAFGTLTTLQYLELGDNNLSGTIPSSLANLVELASLSLLDNDFTGDANFLCTMEVPSLSTDCKETDSRLACDCCTCCQEGSKFTCDQYPNGYALSGKFFVQDCCMGNECGNSCDK